MYTSLTSYAPGDEYAPPAADRTKCWGREGHCSSQDRSQSSDFHETPKRRIQPSTSFSVNLWIFLDKGKEELVILVQSELYFSVARLWLL